MPVEEIVPPLDALTTKSVIRRESQGRNAKLRRPNARGIVVLAVRRGKRVRITTAARISRDVELAIEIREADLGD